MFSEFASKLVPYWKEQLMSNVVREWCRLANVITPTRVFPSGEAVGHNSKVVAVNAVHQHDIETAVKYYSTGISRWIGNRSNFGIVHRYMAQKAEGDTSKDHFPWLRDSSHYQGISLVLFCPREETHQLQQMLTRLRHHWYRKLSKSPLNSGFKSILDEESNRINIAYRPQHSGKSSDVQLDDIILNEEMKKSQSQLDLLKDDRDIIICRTNLDNCVMAFLDDAYTEVEAENRVVLKLNPALVPFKLAITYEKGIDRESCAKLNEVAHYLIANLRDYSDISIFPFVPQTTLTTSESDRLAVQYCVILKEDTLKSGLIWLRNRDTRISETIHISNFVKTALFYLQPEKLINLEEANQMQQG